MRGGEGRRGGEEGGREGGGGSAWDSPADGERGGEKEKKNPAWTFPGWEIQQRVRREWRTVCADKERLEENRNQMREADEGCSITTGEEKVFCGECREEANAGKELWTM